MPISTVCRSVVRQRERDYQGQMEKLRAKLALRQHDRYIFSIGSIELRPNDLASPRTARLSNDIHP